MNFLVNILTMALCVGTMTYCYVLSRQIRALRDMKTGFGTLIEDMIRTTNNLEIAFHTTKQNMEQDYEKLCDKIDEGAALIEYLSMTSEEIKKFKNQSSQTTKVQPPLTKTQTQKSTTDLYKIFENSKVEDDNHSDPLEDVMPKGLSRPVKRPPPYIIPGEEYI